MCVAGLRRQRGLQPSEGSAGLGFQGGTLTRLLVDAGGLAPPSEAFSQRQAWAPRTPQSGCFKGRKQNLGSCRFRNVLARCGVLSVLWMEHFDWGLWGN